MMITFTTERVAAVSALEGTVSSVLVHLVSVQVIVVPEAFVANLAHVDFLVSVSMGKYFVDV